MMFIPARAVWGIFENCYYNREPSVQLSVFQGVLPLSSDISGNFGGMQGDTSEPLAHAHFKAEGDVEFRSVLFIPARAAWDFYDNYYNRKPAVKLYVRRVFISDEFEDLLPRYLSFLLGLVDSDTLPLNVSREMLQQHSSLRTIKKKLVCSSAECAKEQLQSKPLLAV